jgi:hypothetical protein
MAPAYLGQQVAWSLRNLGLRTLDIYCLHNPETQLAFVDSATFRNRLRLAFCQLEEEVASGRIGCYGIATWEVLRRTPMSAGYLSLELIVRLAREVGGENHHLRVIQFPLNAAMLDASHFAASRGTELASAINCVRSGTKGDLQRFIMQGHVPGASPRCWLCIPSPRRGPAARFGSRAPFPSTALVG